MQPVLGWLLIAATVYGIWTLLRKIATTVAAPVARPATVPPPSTIDRHLAEALRKRRLERQRKIRLLNHKARVLQIALLHLSRAPDFRRAASYAALAEAVPIAFRQRLFRRFRPLLLKHMIARLRAHEDVNVLVESLRNLVAGLGHAKYEADYIYGEAHRSLITPPLPPAPPARAPSYDQQLRALLQDHEQRLAAIQGLRALDEDTREQLLEAEETRYRQANLEIGSDGPNTPTR